MVLEAVKQEHQVVFVFFRGLACHQDVVQVHEQEVQILENGIHQPLEGLGGVLETEGHAEELKEPERGDHCRLWDVVGVDRDLMIPADEIHLGEDDHAGQVGREVMDAGDRVPVILGDAIELPEIPARAIAPPQAW